MIIQIGWKNVFDKITHQDVTYALVKKGMVTQFIAVLCKM